MTRWLVKPTPADFKKKNLVIGKKEAHLTCKIEKLKEIYKEFRVKKDVGGTLPWRGQLSPPPPQKKKKKKKRGGGPFNPLGGGGGRALYPPFTITCRVVLVSRFSIYTALPFC